MPYTKIAVFVGALIVIIAALLGVAYFAQKNQSGTATTTPATLISGTGYTIEEENLTDTPDIHKGITFSDSIPANIRPMIQAKANIDIATLEKDKTNAGAWLDLALWYKTANDLDAAKEIWEFMTRAAPNDVTAFDNLGRMYHFDLHDFPKSESYFNQSLALNPKSTTPYIELFELYTLSYKKGTGAAENIIAKGEAEFPLEPGFPQILASYYRDIGRTSEARVQFEKALALARKAGNLELVAAINSDIATLTK
jgi:tetratricopeptide (TPR) repeat protein